jgi:hypothetical protein
MGMWKLSWRLVWCRGKGLESDCMGRICSMRGWWLHWSCRGVWTRGLQGVRIGRIANLVMGTRRTAWCLYEGVVLLGDD